MISNKCEQKIMLKIGL